MLFKLKNNFLKKEHYIMINNNQLFCNAPWSYYLNLSAKSSLTDHSCDRCKCCQRKKCIHPYRRLVSGLGCSPISSFPVEDFVFVTFLLAVSVVVWLGFWFCPGLSMPGVFGSSGLPGFGLSGFSGSGFSGSGFSGFGFSGSSLAWIV